MDESPKRGLLAAYGRLLGPLIRILIRNGVSFGEFSEVAKRAYVEVASKDFRVKPEKISEERVAVLSGMTLAEVREIEERRRREAEAPKSYLVEIVGVLHGWHTDSAFTGPYGIPLELRYSDEGPSEFHLLVDKHAPGASPSRLLQELLKIGAVVETEKGWFKALIRTYIPEPSATEGLDHLARSVEDFVTTLDFNRVETDPERKLFERHVYTDAGISREDLERFKRFAGSKAQLLLEELDNWLSQLEPPRQGDETKLNTGLGIFHYINDDSSESDSYLKQAHIDEH